MPQEPKKRHSRQRKGKRRASIKLQAVWGINCPNCGKVILSHTICKSCGFYKGKQFIVKKRKDKKEPA